MNDRSVGFLGAWLLLLVLASGAAQPAQGDVPAAVAYFVRPDGGSTTQCNGRVSAPVTTGSKSAVSSIRSRP